MPPHKKTALFYRRRFGVGRHVVGYLDGAAPARIHAQYSVEAFSFVLTDAIEQSILNTRACRRLSSITERRGWSRHHTGDNRRHSRLIIPRMSPRLHLKLKCLTAPKSILRAATPSSFLPPSSISEGRRRQHARRARDGSEPHIARFRA